jgi:membrane dipeptidase
MMIVDAHLDLAFNVFRGRNPRQPAAQQPIADREIATVGLPDLRAGKVGLICATIFCEPASPANPAGYTTADQARQQALTQLAWYRDCFNAGELSLVETAGQLPSAAAPSISTILLMEGADGLRSADDLAEWYDWGLRIVGMAWKRTRFAGGTGAPGSLSDEGRALIAEIDRLGMIHDTSHLAEQSFWELLDRTPRSVIASHSNCRAIVGDGDRHLTDAMIRAIGERGGVIGINFFDKFLLPLDQHGKRRATLDDVTAHIQRICDLTGSARHVAIGTDMDGGLGREQIPVEIQTSADLPRVGEALSGHGFSDGDIAAILGGNWTAYFAKMLPT